MAIFGKLILFFQGLTLMVEVHTPEQKRHFSPSVQKQGESINPDSLKWRVHQIYIFCYVVSPCAHSKDLKYTFYHESQVQSYGPSYGRKAITNGAKRVQSNFFLRITVAKPLDLELHIKKTLTDPYDRHMGKPFQKICIC